MIAFLELRDKERQYFRQRFGQNNQYKKGDVSSVEITSPEEIDTISVFVNSEVSREVIDRFPNLEHITTRSTGHDHIDVNYARKNDIAVSNVPSYGSASVAEYAFALLLSLIRNVHKAYHHVQKEGEFSLDGLRGKTLSGKTIGIIGTGAIGSHAVRIADGFGMNIHAYDPNPKQHLVNEYGVSYVDELTQLLRLADVVSLHVPLNEHTRHIIDNDALQTMKSSAYLINTARGGVVNTTALVTAINEKQIAGAALDVLEGESELSEESAYSQHADAESARTLLADHALIDKDNVIVTPHIGFYTEDAEKKIMETTEENIKTYLQDSQPANAVSE